MPPSRCPDEVELRSFAVGNLPDLELDRMVGHVEDCATCHRRLRVFDDLEDGLISGLRGLPTAVDAQGDDPLPDSLRQAARDFFHDEDGSIPGLDPGLQIAHRLADGEVRLGRFELIEELGVGSFGYVFRARDTELDRLVAIKVQRASIFGGTEERDRFRREARSAAQLDHPNIVSVFETGHTEDGVEFIVTELIQGVTLEKGLADWQGQASACAELVATLADALSYAHGRGVVHRDVKPSNVIVDRKNRPHLMDFGLAKRDAGEITVTPQGEVMGTPAYMSPEQARGDSHDVDARSDLYGLGVVFYELLTGERPFQGNRRMLMLQVLEDDPRPPRRLDDRIPKDLETICLKCLAKSPARRYDNAVELAKDLRRHLRGEPIHARPITPQARLLRWCRRNPVATSLFASVTISATVGIVYISELSSSLVRTAAVNGAETKALMLEEFNHFYSDLVDRLDPVEVPITHDYATRPRSLPLPATFLTDAARRISTKTDSGFEIRHYSDAPFPWRKNNGPRDEFERIALDRLRADPADAVSEFIEDEGKPFLRYAKARVMTQSCVDCHNNHRDTPSRDWQVGDVRGVLAIRYPMAREEAEVRKELRGAFVLVGGISFLLLGLGIAVVVGRRQTGRPDAS